MNENSRTRYFLAAPILTSLTDQMLNLGGHIGKSAGKHHQLNNTYIRRQSENVKSLLPVIQEHLSFSAVSSSFTNIMAGQIYSQKITEDLLSLEKIGNAAYKQFVDERLRPFSTKSIHVPIKKIMLKTCKSSGLR